MTFLHLYITFSLTLCFVSVTVSDLGYALGVRGLTHEVRAVLVWLYLVLGRQGQQVVLLSTRSMGPAEARCPGGDALVQQLLLTRGPGFRPCGTSQQGC